jgi:hypothetical protein
VPADGICGRFCSDDEVARAGPHVSGEG